MKTIAVVVCALGLSRAGRLPAQAPGSWHAALEARAGLRTVDPAPADVLRVAEAEVFLGRPDRARLVLQLHEVSDSRVEALAAFAAGDFARAGALFAAAADSATDVGRGLLAARAGEAFELAGLRAAAATSYRHARETLPAVSGWLALREARVSDDTAAAFALLEVAPPAGRFLIPAVRGELLAIVGDTARAVVVLAGAGFDGRAARLALASGDSAGARQLAYRALRSGDTASVAVGIEMARTVFRPSQSTEFLALARPLRRESAVTAADLIAQAVALGDAAPPTLVLLGDVRSEARDYQGALNVYERAARTAGPEGASAGFSVARTLLRLGRPVAANQAVMEFLRVYPAHSLAPQATFLLADLAVEAGRPGQADTLYRAIAQRWPSHDYASQSRFRLAASALSTRDTAGATRWYRAEVEARGVQQTSARYFLASLAARSGDSAAAAAEWGELARIDSLGYFGSIARTRTGRPLPAVAPAAPATVTRELERVLAEIDLLDQIGFAPEASALISSLIAREGDAFDALNLAEALSRRGRITAAINLGWRAARTLTLNHPRVLRSIYPWPLREVVSAEAREFGLDEYLLAALIRQESSFDPGARSRVGARGLMQVMPGTARQSAQRTGVEWNDQLLRVPDANIHVGAAHLAMLLRHYRGELAPALAAYNAGLTPVERWRRRFPEARDPVLFTERIPYAETRGYVRTVLRNWSLYRILYPPETGAGAATGA